MNKHYYLLVVFGGIVLMLIILNYSASAITQPYPQIGIAPTSQVYLPLIIRQPQPLFCDNFDYFDQTRWHKADWGNPLPPFWNYWRPDHIEFMDGKMRIRLDNDPCTSGSGCGGRSYASGEQRSNDLYGYGRFESRLKASNVSGTVTAFFLYTDSYDGNPHDEIDIEILEKDSTKLQTNYYTNGVGGHEAMIDLGFDASQDYHTYAIEWTPAFVKWFVDAQLVHTETGTRGPLPTTPGRIMFNLWTCTDTESGWCGKFVYPGEPIYAYFDRTCYTPYEFPALTATPTNTPVPTDTPTPTVIPNILIDDFENFSDWGLWYGNGAPCSPITQDTGYLGQSIKVSCTTHDTDDWWFVMKSINSDWASYAGVHLWYKETTGSGDMAVAIKDADGELWYASLQSSSVVWEQVFVPFSSFIIDPYDYHGNHNLDLNQVQEFRFRHLPQAITPVTLWVDELRVLQTAP